MSNFVGIAFLKSFLPPKKKRSFQSRVLFQDEHRYCNFSQTGNLDISILNK